jgi:hypothetical protein
MIYAGNKINELRYVFVKADLFSLSEHYSLNGSSFVTTAFAGVVAVELTSW